MPPWVPPDAAGRAHLGAQPTESGNRALLQTASLRWALEVGTGEGP